MWAEGILAERCLLGARVSGNVGSAGRPDVHVRGHAHFLAHSHIRSSPRPRSPSRPCLRLYSYLPTHICVHGHRLGCASSRSRSRDCAHVCVHVLARAPLRARVHEHTLCVNIRLAFCPRSQPSAAADYVQTAVRGSAMTRPSEPRRATIYGRNPLQAVVDRRGSIQYTEKKCRAGKPENEGVTSSPRRR